MNEKSPAVTAPAVHPLPSQVVTSRNMIVGPHLSTGAAAPRIPVGAEAHLCRQPQLTIHQQGDLVKSVEVICSCGEKTVIELIYE